MTERLQVLLVEDNPADVELIREMLPERGNVSVRLESVPRLSRAVSRLKRGNIDLALLDLGLPDSQGLQTFHKLRDAAPEIPIIVLTGNGDQDTAVAAVREGAQDYFIKGEVTSSLLARAAQYAVERRRIQEALRRSEENFRRSLDESPLGVRIVTAGGETLYANRAMLDIYGFDSIEELKATPLKTRYTPDSYTHFLKRKDRRERGELDSPEYEISIIRKNGEIRHLQVFRKEVLWDGEKQYQAIYLDITERQRAEEALRESERKLKTLFEILPVGISILDAERKIVYGNPALATILDISEEGLFRGDYTRRTYLRPDGMPMPAEEYASARAIKEQRAVNNVETGVVKEDENVIWTNVSAVPVAFPDWKVVVVTSDITERREAQEKLKETLGKLRLSLRGIIQVISRTVEMRDSYTAGHQRRVTALSRAIALEMGLAEDRVEGLVMAGDIHDLGKISVPTEILSKPTPLTQFEFQLIRNHPQTGYDILKEIDFPWPIAEIILQHHERIDGSGYPQGLRGADILLEARILAVADAVEAIASDRPYRAALGVDAALEELEQKKGILYDPEVVKACLTLFRQKGFTF